MQKIINAIAIGSGVITLAIVGAGGYVYLNKDALIEKAKGQIMESVMDTLPGGLGGLAGGALVPNPTQLLPSPTETLTDTPQYTNTPVLPYSPF